jgi:hypothetical protein
VNTRQTRSDAMNGQCQCGVRNMVHITGEGGQDERGVFYFHSRGECFVSDKRTARQKLLGAIGRWFLRAAGPNPSPSVGE